MVRLTPRLRHALRGLAIAAALCVALPLLAQQNSAPALAGSWHFVMTHPQEAPIEANATLDLQGDKVTGSIDLPAGRTPLTVVLKGNDVQMSFVFAEFEPGLEIPVALAGRAEGGTIKGTVDYGPFGGGNWTATRVTGSR